MRDGSWLVICQCDVASIFTRLNGSSAFFQRLSIFTFAKTKIIRFQGAISERKTFVTDLISSSRKIMSFKTWKIQSIHIISRNKTKTQQSSSPNCSYYFKIEILSFSFLIEIGSFLVCSDDYVSQTDDYADRDLSGCIKHRHLGHQIVSAKFTSFTFPMINFWYQWFIKMHNSM